MNVIIFGPPGAGKGTQANNIAKKFNLLESGGSDYHGENKPNLNIGFGYENKPLKTPYEFLLKMKEKHAGI